MEAGKRRKYIVLSIAGAMLLLIAVIAILDIKASGEREQRDYQRLEGCTNPAFFEDFMVKYPESEHIDEIRAKYQKYSVLNDEWEAVASKCDREELANFARMNPSSPFLRTCKDMIDSLDWFEAKELNSIAAMEKYMGEHPNGLYVADAMGVKQRIEQRAREAALAAAQADSLQTEVKEDIE